MQIVDIDLETFLTHDKELACWSKLDTCPSAEWMIRFSNHRPAYLCNRCKEMFVEAPVIKCWCHKGKMILIIKYLERIR